MYRNDPSFSGLIHRSEAQLGEEDATAHPGHLLQHDGLANHLHLKSRRRQGIVQDPVQQVKLSDTSSVTYVARFLHYLSICSSENVPNGIKFSQMRRCQHILSTKKQNVFIINGPYSVHLVLYSVFSKATQFLQQTNLKNEISSWDQNPRHLGQKLTPITTRQGSH